jgi:hypothetical protein
LQTQAKLGPDGMHRAFGSHTRPQAPQFPAVLMSTQADPHRVQPTAQAIPQVPPAHVGLPFPPVGTGQTFSHEPQWETSPMTFVQLVPQAIWPGAQARAQVPLAHSVPEEQT